MTTTTFYIAIDNERLEGCLPEDYVHGFLSAQKAIEKGNDEKFTSAVNSMQTALQSAEPLCKRYLDICIRQVVVSRHKRVRCYYFMSLMAYAVIHDQRKIVDILINRKASTCITDQQSGSPLTQALVYCLHNGCPDKISGKMVSHLVESIPEEMRGKSNGDSNFDINVADYCPEKTAADPERELGTLCSPIELALQLQRMDIAKKFVQLGGANPICVHKESEQIIPLFLEFYEFGTNHYYSWLLHEYIPHEKTTEFIRNVLKMKDAIFSTYAKDNFEQKSRRHYVHAPLTCGHAGMIKAFLQEFKSIDDKGTQKNTLRVKDSAGRTALQIAAANGDVESFTTLLEEYTDWVDRRGDDTDIAKSLLAAAKSNRVKILEIILRKDDDALVNPKRPSVLHVFDEQNQLPTWKVAVLEGLSCIFETLRHYDQRVIVYDYDEKGKDTLGHIAARSGNVEMFKAIFPLERKLLADQMQEKVSNRIDNFDQCSMFWSLILENKKGETPLTVAIDCNHYNILESLQKRAIEREQRQNANQNREKTEWKYFWEGYGQKLLVHACRSSSSQALDSVKVLINITKATLDLVDRSWTKDAFHAAVEAGNDEIMNYFLHNFGDFIDEKQKILNTALWRASEHGHHRCVRILLKNGANVEKMDTDDKNNCLMKAIEKKRRETVLTILSDGNLGPKSLQFTRKKTRPEREWNRKVVEHIQPMTLLIREMPDIAEWVLNKCALATIVDEGTDQTVATIEGTDQTVVTIEGTDQTDGDVELQRVISNEDEEGDYPKETETDYVMKNKYLFLDAPPKCEDTSNTWSLKTVCVHPIKTMVKYHRTDMLNHTLVQSWITKSLNDAIPELIIYLLLYLLFLANLTTISLLLPRPGPWNEYCVQIDTVNITSLEGNDTELLSRLNETCGGQSKHLTNFFYLDAVVLILNAIIYLLFEMAQWHNQGWYYITDVENYVQLVMFVSVIIFVFPVGQNSCWCLPGWKWQIGALAVFLAWVNLLLLIRYIPWGNIGERSTMLFNVYKNFVQSLYLPIILLLTFAIPMYMIFVNTMPTEDGEAPTILSAFATPFTTLYKVIFQSAGEIGSDNFIEAPFLYNVSGVVLFLLFIIAIPVLFNNFLIGMAVGETEEERKKASLSLTKRKIYYIFESHTVWYRKTVRRIFNIKPKLPNSFHTSDEKKQEFRAKDKAIKDDIKSNARAKYTKRKVKRLNALVTQNQSSLTSHKVELERSLQTLGEEVVEIRNEVANIKENVIAELAKSQQSLDSVKEDVRKEIKESMKALKELMTKHFE